MLKFVLTCALSILAVFAHAEPAAYNRIDFQVEVGREITNDLLVAQMSVEIQDKHPAQVAQLLNARLNAALKKASAYPGVKTRSGNHRTYPVYGKDNHIDGWRGHAQLVLESRDFKEAGELIAELQTSMQLNGLQFSVANDTRHQAENTLITEAITAFGKRAETLNHALSGSGYKIIHLTIGNGDTPYPHPMLARTAIAADAITAPEFAGGDTRISVQVSGTIEITTK